MDLLSSVVTRRNMVSNLVTSLGLFMENGKQFNFRRTQFVQQKYFLDLAKCDDAVKKLNSVLATISARVINGKYQTKFEFKKKTTFQSFLTNNKNLSGEKNHLQDQSMVSSVASSKRSSPNMPR